MKKLSLALGFLIIIALFASADFYINKITPPSIPLPGSETVAQSDSITKADETVEIPTMKEETLAGYTVKDSNKTTQLFEKFDLSALSNIMITRKRLEGQDSNVIIIYEINGPKSQGTLTYLHIKLQFIAQINGTTETINEVNNLGNSNFFYNDHNHSNTAFMVVLIGDSLYGFQYIKDSPESENPTKSYDAVKSIIEQIGGKVAPAETIN